MFFTFRTFAISLIFLFSLQTSATSIFHSFITDLSPPYDCRLKLKSARGVSLGTTHNYQFSGLCSIKIPVGNTWIYQNVWVDTFADWNGDTNEAFETTTLSGGQGTVSVEMRCDDDPWLTKSQCALVGYKNNTQFTNLGGVYNPQIGQYPPYETNLGQFPPLARNQAILKEAIAMSILTAKQEAAAAHAAFIQAFGGTQPATVTVQPPVRKRITKIYKQPKIGSLRVDCCLSMNKDCGKPAADRYCRSLGHKESVNCKLSTGRCTPTFILGTQTICTSPLCKGFEEVECAN